ncbi:XRE family transcriptional regulator [Streptomyces sp. NPDC102476]|uniref:XRE family transcriptional regulator n=1 Tax=Streptomyces sp. NPDC102476 TaxID=3366181 RepID=UPI0038282AD1
MTERTDFTDLLKARRAELGHSLRTMESRSVDPDSGEQAKFGWLSKVERGESVDPPKEDRIKALAAGYDLPVKVLQIAATRQFFGYDPVADSSVVWSQDLTTRIIVARAEEMTDEDRRQLADIAETFARRKTQRNEGARGKSDD